MAEFMAALSEVGMGNGVAILRELAKRLECPVCLTTMLKPKMLFCNHMVCEQCLLRLKGTEYWFNCPICKKIIWTFRAINTVYQFGSVAEMVKSLMETVDRQVCEGCCNGAGNNFMAMCNKCYVAVNKPMTRKVTEMDDGREVCAVCRKSEEEDMEAIWTPECGRCGRLFHLDCHYPKLCADIGMLNTWECRLCSDETPGLVYGYVMNKTTTKESAIHQRKLLEAEMSLKKFQAENEIV